MNRVSINGTVISGNIVGGDLVIGGNIQVSNGKVIIDGKDVTPDSKTINISIEGDVSKLDVDVCNKIDIKGNVKDTYTMSGDIKCGNVEGNVETVSGDVDCGNVSGAIKTVSGDVTYRR